MSEEKAKLERAVAMIGRGRISRREFVQLAVAAGMTAPAAVSLFTRTAERPAQVWRIGKVRPGARVCDRHAGPRELARYIHPDGLLGCDVQQPHRG